MPDVDRARRFEEASLGRLATVLLLVAHMLVHHGRNH